MADRFTPLDSRLYDYLAAHCAEPDEIVRELSAETEQLGIWSAMQIGTDEAAFLALLVRLSGARRAIEIGTFTGYSALTVARALPADGHLLACDVSEEWTAIARKYWDKAGVADKITLAIAPALETLSSLPNEPHLDFAFIDADKQAYHDYYEALLPRMSAGALITVDNVLWGGSVVDPERDDADTVAIRAFNDRVADDDRVEAVMTPIGDGLTLLRKR